MPDSKYNSKRSGIIIMNPKNGEIYAMALNPNFDLNEYGKVDDFEIYNLIIIKK